MTHDTKQSEARARKNVQGDSNVIICAIGINMVIRMCCFVTTELQQAVAISSRTWTQTSRFYRMYHTSLMDTLRAFGIPTCSSVPGPSWLCKSPACKTTSASIASRSYSPSSSHVCLRLRSDTVLIWSAAGLALERSGTVLRICQVLLAMVTGDAVDKVIAALSIERFQTLLRPHQCPRSATCCKRVW